MSDLAATYITKTLIEAATMADVEGRIFHTQLDQLTGIVYPCVVFGRRMPGEVHPTAPYEAGEIVMQFLSEHSHDEARTLYEAAKALLDKTSTTESGKTVYLRLRRGAFEDTLPPNEGTVYRVICGWEVREVG